MDMSNDEGAKKETDKSSGGVWKGSERLGEVKKSISAEPTIHEEGSDVGGQDGSKRRPSVKNGAASAWRKQYNTRRKSVELSESGQQHQGGSVRFSNTTNTNNKHTQQQQSRPTNGQHAAAAQSAKDRRKAYVRANSHRVFTSSENNNRANANNHAGGLRPGPRIGVSRSMSTNQPTRNQRHDDDGTVSGGERRGSVKKRNRNSTSAGKGRFGSNSVNSINGESFDYDDDMELDEPFSDSDEDSPHHVPSKPSLIVPRGRIRTLSGTVPPVGYSPKWGGPTMCISCLQFFDLPDQLSKFANHLLDEHKIVVTEMELIVDPKRYIEHWRQRFAKETVNQIFPRIVPKEGELHFGRVDFYFEMSERIAEDYSLRQRLAMRRLEEALACQQREREEVCFSMPCIFCRYVARGNRSKLIHHLYMIHHLNLGSPDNLVFVAEYIDHLKDKLQRNECIYCEKTFSDRTVLMDHMRKRNHREVNPKNNYYDKFYIINYLELGKRWLDVLAEDFEDTMPTFADSDDEEEEESWHEWQEDNTDEDQSRAVCLFCNFNAEKLEAILDHSKTSHSFDLLKFIADEKMDVYARMKFLNYVRKQGSLAPKTDEKPIILPEREQWDVEESLVPMYGNDNLPWMLESYLDADESTKKSATAIADDDNKTAEDGDQRAKKLRAAAVSVDLPVEGDWDDVNKSFAFLKRQTSIESAAGEPVEIPSTVQDSIVRAFIDTSKTNTVEGVIAEDWPDLFGSALSDQELYKSLR